MGQKVTRCSLNYLSTAFTFLFGPTSSGNVVTERTAMQTTAVYACVRVLSEAIVNLPLNLYRYTPDGGKEKTINHPLYRLLHDAPNPEMTSFIFRETLMSHLLVGQCLCTDHPERHRAADCTVPAVAQQDGCQ